MSKEIAFRSGRKIKPVTFDQKDAVEVFNNINKFGIGTDNRHLKGIAQSYGMDAMVQPQLGVVAGIPAQFLQTFLPGFVKIATTPTLADELIGVSTVGRWHDEEVVQKTFKLERAI